MTAISKTGTMRHREVKNVSPSHAAETTGADPVFWGVNNYVAPFPAAQVHGRRTSAAIF